MFIKILLAEFSYIVNSYILLAVIDRLIIHVRTGKKVEKQRFILESKMAELNQNKRSQQPG